MSKEINKKEMDKEVFAILLANYGAISILKAVVAILEGAIDEEENLTVTDVISILEGTVGMLKLDSEMRSLIHEVKFPSNKEEHDVFINSISVKEEN